MEEPFTQDGRSERASSRRWGLSRDPREEPHGCVMTGVDAKALGLDGTLVLHVVRVGGAWVREGGGEDRDAMGRACGALWQRGPLRLVLGVRWAPWRA